MRNLRIRDIFPRGESDADPTRIERSYSDLVFAVFYARKRDFRFEKWPQTGTLTLPLPRDGREVTRKGP